MEKDRVVFDMKFFGKGDPMLYDEWVKLIAVDVPQD